MSGKLYSLRRRMVVATLACMLLIFGGIGAGAHAVARRESEELFSARLATSARVLEALVAHQLDTATVSRPVVITLPKELESATDDEPQTYGHRYETKVAFQVWGNDGTLLARSASAPDALLGRLAAGFSKNNIDGQLWQVFALRSGQVWVLVAEKDEVRQEMADDIGLSILMPLVVGGLLMLAAVNVVLVHNMRSLGELARRIAGRQPESLDLIELPATPVELAPIVTELNQLLVRMKAAFEREQYFINSAAHEIRTPIAGVQLHIENALRAASADERERSLVSALTAARRTSKLAEQLLALGRITAKADAASFQATSLTEVCCDVIGTLEPLLSQRGQNIGLEARDDCTVLADRHQLRRLLQNLIDNASVHGAADGDIQVLIVRQGAQVLLSVSNDGASIPEAELERIFTPYYRIPANRTSGHGLGLAIVKEIAQQHGARIAIRRKDNGGGTVVELALPLAGAPGGAA
ncbi:sensor histidine kinase [Massilia rubra]|uniref:histidine kinase n=1 Tax=Massilia rubra TaxID=2607910 RepID=A0ABX0M1U2_9BURK|nr:sensor histidine kinase [Massilia rubra]NHZ38297.1 sensor histidine kinase [Massilia rubra]